MITQLAVDHAQLFGSNLDLGQVVIACFAIPLAVTTTVVFLVQLLTRIGRRHDIDDRVSHLLGNNLSFDNSGPVGTGDELRIDLRREQQGANSSNDGFNLGHKLPMFVRQFVGVAHQ